MDIENKRMKAVFYWFGIPQVIFGVGSVLIWSFFFPDSTSDSSRYALILIVLIGLWSVITGLGIIRGQKWGWVLAVFQDVCLIYTACLIIPDILLLIPDLMINVPANSIAAGQKLINHVLNEVLFISVPVMFGVLQLIVFLKPNTKKNFQIVNDWIGKCPTPVFVWSVFCVASALLSLSSCFRAEHHTSFFDYKLHGVVSVCLTVLVSTLLVAAALGLYRAKRWAWILLIVLNVYFLASGLLTILNTPLEESLQLLPNGKEAFSLLSQTKFLTPWILALPVIFFYILEITYLLWIWKYFKPVNEKI